MTRHALAILALLVGVPAPECGPVGRDPLLGATYATAAGIVFCAPFSPPVAQAALPAKRQPEVWHIVFDPSSGLDAAARINVMSNLRYQYAEWRIKFLVAAEVPEGKGLNVIHVRGDYPRGNRIKGPLGHSWVFGRVRRLDHGNSGPDHMDGDLEGVFVGPIKDWVVFHKVSPVIVDVLVGRVLAHEVGHSLGLYHIESNQPSLQNRVGSPLDNKGHCLPYRVYLDKILGRKARK